MKHQQTSEDVSWEEAVGRYLTEHPDYFSRHPELLEALSLPHVGRGGAASLLERQVEVLRERNANVAEQLQELVGIARENDSIGERLHRFAVALIDCNSLDEVLETAQGLLRQEFCLDAAGVVIEWPEAQSFGRPELVGQNPHFEALWQRCAGQPLCGAKLPPDTLELLLPRGNAAAVRSTAIAPLVLGARRGVLVLASHDVHRFHAGMGTVYLGRLGELFGRCVRRFLPNP